MNKIVSLAAAALLVTAHVHAREIDPPAKRPNVVIIMADDLDSRQLSCYGGKNLQTVHIDQLAKEGMKFNQIICSEAMCVPTRASLFTGLYPMRHGSFQNHKPVYDGLQSVCQYLGNEGYTVALTGKDHSTKPTSIFPFKIVKGFEPNCVSATDDYELNDIRQFVKDQKDNPFCLFIMSINPHAPWTNGDPSEFNADKLVLPPHWIDTKEVRTEFTKYLAEVRRLDNQVGDLQNLLKELGMYDNTIFIFLGEQGPQFPGGKWSLWDNGQKSSMIVRWPGMAKAGAENNAIVQYEDITPTLIDIAGGKPRPDLDGRSFLSVIKGQAKESRPYAYGIHNNIPEGPAYAMRSIRDTHYKLIMNLTSDKEYRIKYMMNPNNAYWTGWMDLSKQNASDKAKIDRLMHHPALEFYDIQTDPYEMHNLAADPKYAGMIAKYKKELEAWMAAQKDPGASADIDYKKPAGE